MIVSDELDNSYQGLGITVDARAEGVQFVSGENSLNATGILDTFGVVAQLDGNGNILSVAE